MILKIEADQPQPLCSREHYNIIHSFAISLIKYVFPRLHAAYFPIFTLLASVFPSNSDYSIKLSPLLKFLTVFLHQSYLAILNISINLL